MKKELLVTKIIQHLEEGLTSLNSADWATATLSYQFPPVSYVHLITNSSFANAAGEKVFVRSIDGPEVRVLLITLIYELKKNQKYNTFIVRAVKQGIVKLEWDYSWDQAFVDEYLEDQALAEGLDAVQAKSMWSRILPWYNNPAFERKVPQNPSQ